MEIKQSVENIKGWVKAHPWAAAAIIGAVILLAFYASKRARSGSGSVDISGGTAKDESGGGGLDALGGGGFGDVMSQLSSSASPEPTPAASTSIPSMTGESMGAEIPFIPSLSEAFSIPASVSSPALVGESGILSQGNGVKPGKGIAARVAKTPLGKKSQEMRTAAKTPAMQHGKGQHYTGYADGIYFVNGYPLTAAEGLPQTMIMPGGRAASLDVLGMSSAPPGTIGAKIGTKKKR
jgi:hypothetical protein